MEAEMVSWVGYRCSDCGKDVDQPGTCADCIAAHRKAAEKMREDLAKQDKKGKRK
jgi:DNA-directed RNA polymerase subunit RPC12/RpoP